MGEKSKKKRLFELLEDPGYYRTPMVIFVESKMGAELLADAVTKVTSCSLVICVELQG